LTAIVAGTERDGGFALNNAGDLFRQPSVVQRAAVADGE
jgi:hypothetical protein